MCIYQNTVATVSNELIHVGLIPIEHNNMKEILSTKTYFSGQVCQLLQTHHVCYEN